MELGIRNSKGADIHNWLVPQRRKLKLELYTPVNRCSEFNLQVASSPPLKPDSFGRRW